MLAAWRIDTTWRRQWVVKIDIADRNGHVFLDETLHPYWFSSSDLFFSPFLPDLLLTFPKLFNQYCSLNGLESDKYHDKEWHGQAAKQYSRIYPANYESHVLVPAYKSSSVESDHEVREDYQHYVMKDLQSVESKASVRVVQTRDVDH